MIDIVSVFENIATSNGMRFHYAGTDGLNLIESNITEEVLFLLAYPLKWGYKNSTYNQTSSVSGSFFLLKQSDFDNVIYNENENINHNQGKYKKNVLPLFIEIEKIIKKFYCGELEIRITAIKDVYNVLDLNADGLFITFEVS